MADAKMMHLHIPDDPELLRALGEMSIRQGHLDFILRRTVKTLANLTPEEGDDATADMTSSQLRKLVAKLARQRLGEGAPLLKLRALLTRCRSATEKRNHLLHAVFEKEVDGAALIRGRDNQRKNPPSAHDVKKIAAELEAAGFNLNEARLVGFLAEALARTKK